jgi:hypothetical protein
MHDFGASRAYLVTTGRVTQAATRWVSGKPISPAPDTRQPPVGPLLPATGRSPDFRMSLGRFCEGCG